MLNDFQHPVYTLDSLYAKANCAVVGFETLAVNVEDAVRQMRSVGMVPYEYYSPADIVAEYLRHGFDGIVDILEWLKRIDPDGVVRALGERIASVFRRLYELVRGELHGLHRRFFVQRMALVCDITTPGFIALRQVPARFARVPPIVFRKMVFDRIADSFRHLLAIVRDALRFMEVGLCRGERRIAVGAWASSFVYLADASDKVLVLADGEGRKEVFNVSSPAVWSHLRILIGTADAKGLVTLPKGFRGAYVTKDAKGDQVHDDLWRLSLHIHSAGDGKYYLSPIQRRPNTVDLSSHRPGRRV